MLRRSLAVSILVILSVPFLPSVARAAATITVDTTDDVSVTDCTLRDAITAANSDAISGACPAGSGTDLIDITATGTILLGSALPSITTNLTIEGPGAADLEVRRDSGGDYRVFQISSAGVATISDLTVSNGLATTIGTAGGGIANFGGAVTLDRLVVTGNSVSNISDTVNPAPGGGGVFNSGFGGPGTMTIRRSTITANSVTTTQTATSGTHSADALGGGIYNTGSLTIERSTVSGNAVSATVDSPDMSASSFAAGGAIVNFSTIVLKQSTVSGNVATATATGQATGTERGAIYNLGSLTVSGATIAFNTGGSSANLSAQGAETVTSTIISDPQSGPNCDGSINTDGAFNIESPADCAGITGTSTDPLLEPLGDNGGPTETHGLPAASPAIDAGTSSSEVTDQRGFARVVNLTPANAADGADVGALERQPTLGTAIDGGPSGPTNDPTPTFIFSATDPNSDFECSIDSGTPAFGPCEGNLGTHTPTAPLAEGNHTFRVRAVTASGVPDPDPATRDFLVDTVAPTDPVVSSTSHQTGTASADPTVDVTWSGATDGGGSGVSGFSFDWTTTPTHVPDQVQDANQSVAGTTSPTLPDGQHWFHLRTRDQADNWTSTVHLGPFGIDTSAPDTTVTKKPKKKLTTAKKRVRVTFGFASTEPGSTFECSLDAGAFASCSSPRSFKVRRGRHTFRMRATDGVGNTDPTPAFLTFRVVRR
jgi:CSLREA domain-containing protein